ncbi:D-alanine--poly(phosphoribitol) ligase subunit DltC [Aminipila luticellarii]|uniref:D-alanyl carrier protein n=1 Tax=Aminipila luticellarii TaxID=2507160 RepID=A0A410PWQ5_9FIRM|nr:D-alanine--poly(phosphoribitol) ligase subunit DltC [Aminipila luticellarii]QAT43371.1 D-alanine--poly(phosphoribitol) ligase subunit DltC [Aminipila luticellarii]
MKEKILNMLAEICEDDIVKENLEIDLLKTDLLDSLGFAELLALVEEEFGIVLSPSEFQREDLSTPAKIIGIIQARG